MDRTLSRPQGACLYDRTSHACRVSPDLLRISPYRVVRGRASPSQYFSVVQDPIMRTQPRLHVHLFLAFTTCHLKTSSLCHSCSKQNYLYIIKSLEVPFWSSRLTPIQIRRCAASTPCASRADHLKMSLTRSNRVAGRIGPGTPWRIKCAFTGSIIRGGGDGNDGS